MSAMFVAYYSLEDGEIIARFDEATQIDFITRKTEFETIIGKPYTELNYEDIDNIRDNLHLFQVICCKDARGTRKKMKKTKKIKKVNKRKRTRAHRTT